jgi:hypothetical protein
MHCSIGGAWNGEHYAGRRGYRRAVSDLAAPGATVDTIDFEDDGRILVVERAELEGVRDGIRFYTANAAEIAELFREKQFDLIIYPASVEHMTFVERTRRSLLHGRCSNREGC